jgi:hypothetical protein
MILRDAVWHPHRIFRLELDAGKPRFLVAFGTIHAFASAAEHGKRCAMTTAFRSAPSSRTRTFDISAHPFTFMLASERISISLS